MLLLLYSGLTDRIDLRTTLISCNIDTSQICLSAKRNNSLKPRRTIYCKSELERSEVVRPESFGLRGIQLKIPEIDVLSEGPSSGCLVRKLSRLL